MNGVHGEMLAPFDSATSAVNVVKMVSFIVAIDFKFQFDLFCLLLVGRTLYSDALLQFRISFIRIIVFNRFRIFEPKNASFNDKKNASIRGRRVTMHEIF